MAEPLRKSPRSERVTRPEIERCRKEIAGIEAQLRSGHRDLHGLLLALTDWHAELRLLQRDTLKSRKEVPSKARNTRNTQRSARGAGCQKGAS